MKRIVQSSIGAVLLIVLNFAVLAFIPTDEFANGTLTTRPLWVEVLAFPLRYGAHMNKRFLLPEADNCWTFLRWSDVVANFVGAFLFFVLWYHDIHLSRPSRRVSTT
jgi:hypothetical protein